MLESTDRYRARHHDPRLYFSRSRMISSDLVQLTLTDVADAIRKKKVSSVEITRAVLAWVDQVQPMLNCFISLAREDALAAARDADALLARGGAVGPLHGVPLAHKDMFYRQGKISTCGSKILADTRQTVTATVVRKLEAAGAIWLGGLNMGEFASEPTGGNAHFGRCRNPWGLDYVTGGSSSGSASAVSARASYASLGSDTGGSIRTPAAICGVVGLKPTNGRVSTFGAMPRAWSHDCVGPLARTVRDCAKVLTAIAGPDSKDPRCLDMPAEDYEESLSTDLKGLRVGVPDNYFYDGTTADVQACMDESLKVLESLGARLIRVRVPDPQRVLTLSIVMTECESSAFHAAWMRTRPQDYSAGVRGRFEPGLDIPAVRYIEAMNERPRLREEFMDQVFERVDLVHTPVLSIPVPRIAEVETAGKLRELIPFFTRNTRTPSYLGFPALTVPAGFSANAIPVAFQLFARPYAESVVLRAGAAYQQATDWHQRRPPLRGL
jgi:aspartyl-tRNA(Asn)/glutamyl-tRNA(Gln) amidotransferase subunit A